MAYVSTTLYVRGTHIDVIHTHMHLLNRPDGSKPHKLYNIKIQY